MKFLTTNLYIFCLNTILMMSFLIGIQNNVKQRKVNLLFFETIQMPVAFIVGSSFVLGSTSGGLIFSLLNFKKRSSNQS